MNIFSKVSREDFHSCKSHLLLEVARQEGHLQEILLWTYLDNIALSGISRRSTITPDLVICVYLSYITQSISIVRFRLYFLTNQTLLAFTKHLPVIHPMRSELPPLLSQFYPYYVKTPNKLPLNLGYL